MLVFGTALKISVLVICAHYNCCGISLQYVAKGNRIKRSDIWHVY